MKRRNAVRRTLAGLMMLVMWMIAGGARSWAGTEPGLRVGDTFPNLADFSLEGELPKSLPGKLVIVDFWASWCGHCRGTFPLMEKLHQRLEKRGLVIIAVNEDKSRAAMEEFLKQYRVSFNI